MQLRIERLSNGPAAIAHSPEGKTIFVDQACPGDLVEAEIYKEESRYSKARIVKILEPGSARIQAPCSDIEARYVCPWAHISLEKQHEAKRKNVIDLLNRMGKIEHDKAEQLVEELRFSKEAWSYRNKLELSVAFQRNKLILGIADENGQVHELKKSSLFDERFAAIPQALQGALNFALKDKAEELGLERVGIRASKRSKDLEIALWTKTGPFPRSLVSQVLKDSLKPSSIVRVMLKGSAKSRQVSKTEQLYGKGCWSERLFVSPKYELEPVEMLFSAPSFFQVNTKGAELLVEACLELLDPQEDEYICDLYSGAGTFTLPLAQGCSNVAAVESYGSSVRDLRRNLEHNALYAEVIGGDATREFKDLSYGLDKLVIDPPRSGLSKEIIELISEAAPKKIVYVSCDPACLARDIALFIKKGVFFPERLIPVDLFSQTPHVETVCLMTRVR